MFRSPACGTVRDLVLALYRLWHHASAIDLENTSFLLRNAGNSLHTLTLLVQSGQSLQGEGPLDLSQNTNLTALRIRVRMLEAINWASDPAALLACVQLVHSAQERVDVCLVLSPEQHPNTQHTPGGRPCGLSANSVSPSFQSSTYKVLGEHRNKFNSYVS